MRAHWLAAAGRRNTAAAFRSHGGEGELTVSSFDDGTTTRYYSTGRRVHVDCYHPPKVVNL